mgnify:FL=1
MTGVQTCALPIYQLHQTDYDGNATLSPIVSAKLENAISHLSAWPNPFDTGTQILLTLTEETDVRILIINDLGQIVQQLDDSRREAGSNIYNFNSITSHCSKGIYLLYANIGGQLEQIRLIAE